MCNCGCNTCETKGPLLTEGKVKSLLSEGLQYHIDKRIPLFETVYRIGSKKHLSLIKEARKMYSRNVIDLCEEDEALIKTHLGEFALYEGVSIPLDLPMLNESYDYDEVAQSEFGMDYDQLGSGEKEWVRDEIDNMSMDESLNEKEGVPHYTKDGKEWKGKLHKMPDGSLMSGNPHDKNGSGPNGESEKLYHKEDLKEDRKYNQEELLRLDLIARRRFDCDYEKCTDEQKSEVLKDKIKVGVKEALQEAKKEIDEAEFKGKKVSLGKPKRGGPKAYYVYVKDGDKVKKVTFGSGGLRAKIKNKEARNAFAARHNCKDKKDRTKAGYWSCNLPRYAPALGLGAKMNTFW